MKSSTQLETVHKNLHNSLNNTIKNLEHASHNSHCTHVCRTVIVWILKCIWFISRYTCILIGNHLSTSSTLHQTRGRQEWKVARGTSYRRSRRILTVAHPLYPAPRTTLVRRAGPEARMPSHLCSLSLNFSVPIAQSFSLPCLSTSYEVHKIT